MSGEAVFGVCLLVSLFLIVAVLAWALEQPTSPEWKAKRDKEARRLRDLEKRCREYR